ncbi:delta(14)-sterol reductase TM7SF2 isoform X2 [Diceros bicornis minor]|uniref:delta(14)-sterol reductase TM7SF2 isoform X2 n=1 Tax=Diceros bicornis minor TaxID=77932 RepID=UPI0026F11B80|nr:delta(14)-sterol reductase TM7SF2 isoform X2 [Diceros bicornis minor]
MGRGRVHLKTSGQERALSKLSAETGAGAAGSDPPRHRGHLLGDGVGCVSLTDFCEPPTPGGPETMAPPQSSRASLDFGGPLGAAALILLLPATMFHLLLVARSGPARLLGPPPYLPGPEALWSPRALLLLLTWLGLQAALYLLPARKVVEGQELKNKSRLRYPVNGFQALVVTGLLVGLGVSAGLPLGALPEMLLPLAFAATLTAFVFSLLLYLKALVAPAYALAPAGNSGNPIYDFFLGRELNPRICSFDFKYFCELRPGLMAWVLINLALLLQEAELRGSPSLAMWLVNGFQLLYVADALWHELSATTSSVEPIPRKTPSERILLTPEWLALRPYLQLRGDSCWCLGGGVWSAIPTTLETSSWLWPGPCPAGCPTCCPTSTSSTSPRCWCTGRPGMSSSACRNTAWPGTNTASVCLTALCPTSTDAAPPTRRRARARPPTSTPSTRSRGAPATQGPAPYPASSSNRQG